MGSWHDASVSGKQHDEQDALREAMQRVRGGAAQTAPRDNVVELRPRRRSALNLRGKLKDTLARVEEPAAAVWPGPVAGLVSGAWAGVMSWLAIALIVILGWVFAPLGSGQFRDVMRASAVTWMLADGGSVRWQGAVLSLPPMLATVGILLFQRRAGRWLVGAVAAETPLQVLWPFLCALAAASSVHALIAATAANDTLHIGLVRNITGSAIVAVIGFGWGIVRELEPVWPAQVVAVARAVVAFIATLAAAATLLLVALAVAQRKPFLDVLGAVAGDTTSKLQVLAVSLLYLPTLVVWVVAVLLGTGFTLGAGTHVLATSMELGALPPLPLLAILPNAMPGWAPWLMLSAAVAGAAATWRLRGNRDWRARAGTVVAVGLLFALAGFDSAGGIGPGRLASVGTGWSRMSMLAAGWVALALLVDEVTHHVRKRLHEPAPEPTDAGSGT